MDTRGSLLLIVDDSDERVMLAVGRLCPSTVLVVLVVGLQHALHSQHSGHVYRPPLA